jgi:hypothetical protein
MKKYLFALIFCICMLCGSVYSNVPFLSLYDFNQDGIVNYPDLKIFAEGWLTSYNNIEFAAFGKDWMKSTTLFVDCHTPTLTGTYPLYYQGYEETWSEPDGGGFYTGGHWYWTNDTYAILLDCCYDDFGYGDVTVLYIDSVDWFGLVHPAFSTHITGALGHTGYVNIVKE